eukprot:3647192-Pyramimonas_sp.AAC.1
MSQEVPRVVSVSFVLYSHVAGRIHSIQGFATVVAQVRVSGKGGGWDIDLLSPPGLPLFPPFRDGRSHGSRSVM